MGQFRKRRMRWANIWLWTATALGGLGWGIVAVVFAAIGPSRYVPHVFYSYHIEHFVAFYVLTTLAAIGFVRIKLLHIVLSFILMALVLATVRLLIPRHIFNDAEDLAADLAGIAAVAIPIMVGRFRQSFGAAEPL